MTNYIMATLLFLFAFRLSSKIGTYDKIAQSGVFFFYILYEDVHELESFGQVIFTWLLRDHQSVSATIIDVLNNTKVHF
jgi:hypothetical protein